VVEKGKVTGYVSASGLLEKALGEKISGIMSRDVLVADTEMDMGTWRVSYSGLVNQNYLLLIQAGIFVALLQIQMLFVRILKGQALKRYGHSRRPLRPSTIYMSMLSVNR